MHSYFRVEKQSQQGSGSILNPYIYLIISLGAWEMPGISGLRGLYAALDVHGYARARTSIYIYILEVQGRASRGLHFFPKPIVNLGTHREPWYQDLGTRILVPRSWYQILVPGSWYQDLGAKNISVPCRARILVPGSWYQDLGTKVLVPRSWYQDLGTKISSSGTRGP